MSMRFLRLPGTALLAASLFAASTARADVSVAISGNTATADIHFVDSGGVSRDAEVTIVFDSVTNLSAQSLNLTATLFDPNDSTIGNRLPPGFTIDPAFPVMITVEPPMLDWVFTSGMESGEDGTGSLSFHNDYRIEIHSPNLPYTLLSPYRLVKAPIGDTFADVTKLLCDDAASCDDEDGEGRGGAKPGGARPMDYGSVRARGRGGAFSQFMVVKDGNLPLLEAVAKLLVLDTRLLGAIIGNLLQLQLLALLGDINLLLNPLLPDCSGALPSINNFIDTVRTSAGDGGIANLWRAQHDVTNDAGELLSLAYTLQFSLYGCSAQ